MSSDSHQLGYQGLLDAGKSSQEAWQILHAAAASSAARAVFAQMESTPAGREMLEDARRAWARHGLPAPFDDLPDAEEAQS
jgi:hypothetical protein